MTQFLLGAFGKTPTQGAKLLRASLLPSWNNDRNYLFLDSQEAGSTSFLLNIQTVLPIKLEKCSCTGSRTIILAGHISDSELNTLLACSLSPVSWKNEILDNTIQYTPQPFPTACCSKPLEAVPLLKFSFSQFLVPKEAAKQVKLFKHKELLPN